LPRCDRSNGRTICGFGRHLAPCRRPATLTLPIWSTRSYAWCSSLVRFNTSSSALFNHSFSRPASILDDGPTSKRIRQILGAVGEFDRAMIVVKLKGAPDRVRRRAKKVRAKILRRTFPGACRPWRHGAIREALQRLRSRFHAGARHNPPNGPRSLCSPRRRKGSN
jgi:hypothetical protein